MSRSAIAFVLGSLLWPVTAAAQSAITEQEAQSIAVDAYIYFYPLVTMDVTRKQLTNKPPGSGSLGGPMNTFANADAFPSADFKAVVRPNFDTLYSSGYLDLTKEPMVVSVPNTGGRYYLLPILDMWSDVFASPGWRTTGTQAGNFLVTPRGWSGAVPAGFAQIEAPTPYVWIIGRTKTDGPPDYDAVHKIQAGYKITPLSEWGKPPKPVEIKIDPSVDMKTPPKTQVDTLSGDKYFTYAAELLKLHPPHLTDQPIVARMKRISIEPGKSFDMSKVDPVMKKALEDAPAAAQNLMAWKLPTIARVVNYWSMNTDTMGVYGNYYLKRAIVAQLGLGANLPEDAIYPLNLADETGKPLGVEREFQRLLAEPKSLAQAAADRHGPFFPFRDPVRRDVRRRANSPSIPEVITHEWIEQQLVRSVTAARWPAEGPDVVGHHAEDKRAGVFEQKCCRRAGAPFVDSKRRVRCSWVIEHRPNPPVEVPAVLW